MGQCTRISRANRFIEEFKGDIVPHLSLTPGTNLTVESVALHYREGEGEQVVAYALLRAFNGGQAEVELSDDGLFFDPEFSDFEDIAEWLAERFHLDYEDVLRRLRERVDRPPEAKVDTSKKAEGAEDVPDDEQCVCEQPGYFYSGVPGIIARVVDGHLVAGASVEQCDACQLYPTDCEARQALEKVLKANAEAKAKK